MAILQTLLTNLKTTLQNQQWPSSSNAVFPSVVVSAGLPNEALRTFRVPVAVLIPGSGQADPLHDEEPDYIVTQVTVRLIVQHHGDVVGEAALMGGHKSGGATKSEGRGVLELEEQMHDAVGKLLRDDSISLQFRRRGGNGPIYLDEKQYWAYQDYVFEAITSAT